MPERWPHKIQDLEWGVEIRALRDNPITFTMVNKISHPRLVKMDRVGCELHVTRSHSQNGQYILGRSCRPIWPRELLPRQHPENKNGGPWYFDPLIMAIVGGLERSGS